MRQDVTLNVHWSAPEEVWERIWEVYQGMPFWAGDRRGARWVGEGIDLWASVEPGGLQIAGRMPEEIWDGWYALLREKLSQALGYPVGEPEEGFPFFFWE